MTSFSTDPLLSSSPMSDVATLSTDLLTQLKSASEKTQIQRIETLAALGEPGAEALMTFLSATRDMTFDNTKPNLAIAKAYQVLYTVAIPWTVEYLQTHFPEGVVPLRSQGEIDYRPLQILLAKQDFQAADQLTLQKLCELAGSAAVQRKWIYFTEVGQLPEIDLQTLNALWLAHSGGKFGFSVQRDIWLSVGKNWEKLWVKIGWKEGNNWTRYPQSFTWDLTAPAGHLPLSNQLRGVRAIASLLTHSAWVSTPL